MIRRFFVCRKIDGPLPADGEDDTPMTKPIRRTALLPLSPASADAGPFDCKDAVIALELRRAEEPGFSTGKP